MISCFVPEKEFFFPFHILSFFLLLFFIVFSHSIIARNGYFRENKNTNQYNSLKIFQGELSESDENIADPQNVVKLFHVTKAVLNVRSCYNATV